MERRKRFETTGYGEVDIFIEISNIYLDYYISIRSIEILYKSPVYLLSKDDFVNKISAQTNKTHLEEWILKHLDRFNFSLYAILTRFNIKIQY